MAEELFAYLDRIKEMNPNYLTVRGEDGNFTVWYNLREKNIDKVDKKVIATLVGNIEEDELYDYTLSNTNEDWLKQLLELSSPFGEVRCLFYNQDINTWGGGTVTSKLFIFVDDCYALMLCAYGSY